MKTKKFLLTVTHDDRTRMLNPNVEELEGLRVMLQNFYQVWTSGPVPKVEIKPVEELVDDRH